METKSRFEVLKELNDKKESLLREKNTLDEQLLAKKREYKKNQRIMEDAVEEISQFEKSIPDKKNYIDELIKATEASISSLQQINANKS
jgi:hypothetical protein